MSSNSRRSSITDEYFFERIDETTVKFTPPAPKTAPAQQQGNGNGNGNGNGHHCHAVHFTPHFCCMHVCDNKQQQRRAPSPDEAPLPAPLPLPLPVCPALCHNLSSAAHSPPQTQQQMQPRYRHTSTVTLSSPRLRSSSRGAPQRSESPEQQQPQLVHEVSLRYGPSSSASNGNGGERNSRSGNCRNNEALNRSKSTCNLQSERDSSCSRKVDFKYDYAFNETKTVTTTKPVAADNSSERRVSCSKAVAPQPQQQQSSFISKSTNTDNGNARNNNNGSNNGNSLSFYYEQKSHSDDNKRVSFKSDQQQQQQQQQQSRSNNNNNSDDEENACARYRQPSSNGNCNGNAQASNGRSQEMDFFNGEMRSFFVNNDGVKWHGAPHDFHIKFNNWF